MNSQQKPENSPERESEVRPGSLSSSHGMVCESFSPESGEEQLISVPTLQDTYMDSQSSVIKEIMDALAEIVHVPEPESTEKLHISEPDPLILTGTPTIQETHMDFQSESGNSSV